MGAYKSKTKVIYNEIDVSKLYPIFIKKEQHEFTVVHVGRTTLVKDVVNFIQSIKHPEVILDFLCLNVVHQYEKKRF